MYLNAIIQFHKTTGNKDTCRDLTFYLVISGYIDVEFILYQCYLRFDIMDLCTSLVFSNSQAIFSAFWRESAAVDDA